MSTFIRSALVSLVAALFTGLAGPAWGQSYFLPGTIYDQDKQFRDVHGCCNWYYDPGLDGYQYGDIINNSQAGELYWSRQADNSCWMATAANMLRYVGGPDMYETWAYGPKGVWCNNEWRHWNTGGRPPAGRRKAMNRAGD